MVVVVAVVKVLVASIYKATEMKVERIGHDGGIGCSSDDSCNI